MEDLLDDPQSFTFFQAVRLLQRLRPDREPVGAFGRPDEEVVRFSVNPSLAFPAGEIQDLRIAPAGAGEMEVNFMGLVGNQGVLPAHYSLLAGGDARGGAPPLRSFLDIFQHRIVSLFYGAWERSRFYVPYEREEPDRVSSRLRDLIGIGTPSLRDRMSIRDESFLFYCGLLAARQRSAVPLEQLLEDYFQVPVQVQQFVGGWYGLSESQRCRLDEEPEPNGIGLGEGTVVGDEVWDPQARIRIRIGPLARDEYEDFLPGGDANEALSAITDFFGGGQFDFEAQLVMSGDEVPGIVLGDGDEEAPPPLGWCTWIRTRPLGRDADETTLSL